MNEKSSVPSYFDDLRVMVIDDQEYMRTVMYSILRSLEIGRVQAYADAVAAYAAMKDFGPNLILTDWEMKPVDGLQLVRRIRMAKDGPDRHVPIVMVTGHNHVDKVMRARNAGANDFLIKPLAARSVYLRIRATMEKPRPFVTSETYFGPDRRRRDLGPSLGGAERRVVKKTTVVAA